MFSPIRRRTGYLVCRDPYQTDDLVQTTLTKLLLRRRARAVPGRAQGALADLFFRHTSVNRLKAINVANVANNLPWKRRASRSRSNGPWFPAARRRLPGLLLLQRAPRGARSRAGSKKVG
jgi:hypothetical protein